MQNERVAVSRGVHGGGQMNGVTRSFCQDASGSNATQATWTSEMKTLDTGRVSSRWKLLERPHSRIIYIPPSTSVYRYSFADSFISSINRLHNIETDTERDHLGKMITRCDKNGR